MAVVVAVAGVILDVAAEVDGVGVAAGKDGLMRPVGLPGGGLVVGSGIGFIRADLVGFAGTCISGLGRVAAGSFWFGKTGLETTLASIVVSSDHCCRYCCCFYC